MRTKDEAARSEEAGERTLRYAPAIREQGRQAGARYLYEHGPAAALFRHRQAVNSWAKAGHSEIPAAAREWLRGEREALVRAGLDVPEVPA